MSSYKDIIAWQRAMTLIDAIYEATNLLPKTEMFGLSAQMRSAPVSIATNIAEGKGRGTDRDFRYFVIRARGSTLELETEIQIAQRQRFFDAELAERLVKLTAEVGKAINGLIAYLDSCLTDD